MPQPTYLPHRIHTFGFELWRGDQPDFVQAAIETFSVAGQNGIGYQDLGQRGRPITAELETAFGAAGAVTAADTYTDEARAFLRAMQEQLPALGTVSIRYQNVEQITAGYLFKVLSVTGNCRTAVARFGRGYGSTAWVAPCILTAQVTFIPHKVL